MNKKKESSSVTRTLIRLLVYIIVVIIIVILAKGAYRFGYSVFADRRMEEAPGVDVTVTVKPGMSTRKLGELLERKGLIKNAKVFAVQERLSGYKGQIKPGSYILNTSYDVNKLLSILSQEEDTGETKESE